MGLVNVWCSTDFGTDLLVLFWRVLSLGWRVEEELSCGDASLSSHAAGVVYQLVCWFVYRQCNAFRVVMMMLLVSYVGAVSPKPMRKLHSSFPFAVLFPYPLLQLCLQSFSILRVHRCALSCSSWSAIKCYPSV